MGVGGQRHAPAASPPEMTQSKYNSYTKQVCVCLFRHAASHESISSQNSVLLHDLCRRVCEPQLSSVVTNEAVLWTLSDNARVGGPLTGLRFMR
jgi:hypothetical protein